MKYGKFLLGVLTIALLAGANYDISKPRIGRFDDQDRGPAFSSPKVEMHENGDRKSNYPPYYHPDRGR